MSDEKPIRLDELQDRANTEEETQLEDGIVVEAPHGWFENVQREVDETQPPTSPPDRPVH